jgi:hypothetical protein
MSFLVILTVALTTFATRVVPFLIFPKGKEIPAVIQYLGKVLTPAVIGMLVVYCLKATPVMKAPHGLPEASGGGYGRTARLEEEQSSEHRRRDDPLYGTNPGCILIRDS